MQLQGINLVVMDGKCAMYQAATNGSFNACEIRRLSYNLSLCVYK